MCNNDSVVRVVFVPGVISWGFTSTHHYWGACLAAAKSEFQEYTASLHSRSLSSSSSSSECGASAHPTSPPHRPPELRLMFASPGPISSHHDRACELFAEIRGGLTDYGAAHSHTHGHSRWGRNFAHLADKTGQHRAWSSHSPVHLVCHSSGANTARYLQLLLARDYWGVGSSADWVRSLVSLSGNLNGTMFVHYLITDAHTGLAPQRKWIKLCKKLRCGMKWCVRRGYKLLNYCESERNTNYAYFSADSSEPEHIAQSAVSGAGSDAECAKGGGEETILESAIEWHLQHWNIESAQSNWRAQMDASPHFMNSTDNAFYDATVHSAIKLNNELIGEDFKRTYYVALVTQSTAIAQSSQRSRRPPHDTNTTTTTTTKVTTASSSSCDSLSPTVTPPSECDENDAIKREKNAESDSDLDEEELECEEEAAQLEAAPTEKRTGKELRSPLSFHMNPMLLAPAAFLLYQKLHKLKNSPFHSPDKLYAGLAWRNNDGLFQTGTQQFPIRTAHHLTTRCRPLESENAKREALEPAVWYFEDVQQFTRSAHRWDHLDTIWTRQFTKPLASQQPIAAQLTLYRKIFRLILTLPPL